MPDGKITDGGRLVLLEDKAVAIIEGITVEDCKKHNKYISTGSGM